MTRFADRLTEAVERVGAPACVGLDPVLDKLPPELRGEGAARVEAFSMGVLDAVAGVAAAVKPQSACYERFGEAGVGALRRVSAAAHERGLVVVLDAKRGDIGVTAEHYAHAAFAPLAEGGCGADALTVNAYLGMDTLEPALRWCGERGRGVFVLVRTSNPGSDGVQSRRLEDGRTVAELMADEVARVGSAHFGARGLSDVGAVVAATKPGDAAALRARMARQVFLVPGFGAQGGTPETVRELFLSKGEGGRVARGAIVTASRSVIYPEATGGSWTGAVRDAAERFAEELRAIAG